MTIKRYFTHFKIPELELHQDEGSGELAEEKTEICGPSGRGPGSWQREARDRAILWAEWTRSWHLAERSQR